MGYLSSYSGQEIDNNISINSTQNDRLTAIENINNAQNDRLTAIETSIQNLNNKIYPVGSIYISVNNTSPANLFGGTWEQLKDRFLLGAGASYSAGSTGGEATHTLTVAEMPNHYHQQYVGALDGGWGERSDYDADQNCAGFPQGMTGSAGGNQPHNNMPPYLAVYMWKRIS